MRVGATLLPALVAVLVAALPGAAAAPKVLALTVPPACGW